MPKKVNRLNGMGEMYMSYPLIIKDGVLTGCDGNYNGQSVEIPEGVTSIGEDAFAYCSSLTEVKIPESVTSIGERAFYECNSLREVKIPEGVTSIGERAFYECNNLREVKIPEGVTGIGERAFYECNSLREVKIPEGVTSIGEDAFAYCSSLTEVKIPEGVTSIGEDAFAYCSSLTEVKIPEGVTSIGESAFYECNSLREVKIPEGVTSIGEYAFAYCRSLTEVKIPEGLKVIGGRAFKGCSLIKEIDIPRSVYTIGYEAFMNCYNLKKIQLPNTIENIGNGIFTGCGMLADENGFVIVNNVIQGFYGEDIDVEIPEGIVSIEDKAFRNTDIVSVKLPLSLRNFGTAFEGCYKLKNIVVPPSVTEIKGWAFCDCSNLSEIVLPEGLKLIGNDAFKKCKKLRTITIPESVKKIGDEAFSECAELKNIKLLSENIEISDSAFTGCTSLKDKEGFTIVNNILYRYDGIGGSVTVPEGVTRIVDDVFREGCDRDGFRHIKQYRKEGTLKNIKLPDTLEEIGNNVFEGCTKLKSVYIPSKVTYIGSDVFKECESLNKILVDDENTVYSAMDGILMNKSREEIIYAPAGKKFEKYVIPSSVNTIDEHAFFECESLEKIVIPASVKNIRDEAFPRKSWRKGLNDIEVDIKAGTGTIGKNVFDITNGNMPIVYPKLPVTFVKEQATRVMLALGYCLNPEKYEGEYEKIYKKFVDSHKKTLIGKAKKIGLQGIEEYFSSGDVGDSIFKPDLSIKKPSEHRKVTILEETIQKGTLQDLIDVIDTYKTFEMTARALALAGRYRGIEFVKILLKNGASFNYEKNTAMARKYVFAQKASLVSYNTEYYIMLAPEKMIVEDYGYSPLCGVSKMNISPDMIPLSLEKRIEVVRYLANNKNSGISLDGMLYWALTNNELTFADKLMEMGANLRNDKATYVSTRDCRYIDIVTDMPKTKYWDLYMDSIASLSSTCILPVLERFGKLAEAAGKRLVISQTMFDRVCWSDEALTYVVKNADITKINQKKALEIVVSKRLLNSLEAMTEAGWLSKKKKREELIEFARINKYEDGLAWLMDFKNRTVDIAKEHEKEEANMFKMLTEDPNSVASLKKKWSYVKLEDGTLEITSYKGNEVNVEVPTVIGKSLVTTIGKETFSPWKNSIINRDARSEIRSIIIPEGVSSIGTGAFKGCSSLTEIHIPEGVHTIGDKAFSGCRSLTEIHIPEGVRAIGYRAFEDCDQLQVEVYTDSPIIGYLKRFNIKYVEIEENNK